MENSNARQYILDLSLDFKDFKRTFGASALQGRFRSFRSAKASFRCRTFLVYFSLWQSSLKLVVYAIFCQPLDFGIKLLLGRRFAVRVATRLATLEFMSLAVYFGIRRIRTCKSC
jgi:hypothetical protein